MKATSAFRIKKESNAKDAAETQRLVKKEIGVIFR